MSNETSWPRPRTPRLSARASYQVARYVVPRPVLKRLASFLERHPALRRLFTTVERKSKETLFGCRMCGQCALPATGYACPMTCPKQLRNGPCGGVGANGECEVFPDLPCVWVTAARRTQSAQRTADYTRLQRPVDQRLQGTSSWINYWQGRDDHLWTEPAPRHPKLLPLLVENKPR